MEEVSGEDGQGAIMFSFIIFGAIVFIIALIIIDFFDKKEARELYTKSDEAPAEEVKAEEVKAEEQAAQQVDEPLVKKPKRKYTRRTTQK